MSQASRSTPGITPGITPGTTIERYRIERMLGAGSMGDVYCGLDIDLKRKVAVKILSDRHRDNRELRARFVREARAVAAISHPNVVQVFTTGSYDDRPYLAMELLDGTDLGTSVQQQGPWPALQTARAILDAARGLEGAAKAGLIHRDVKPSNLVLLQGGVVKVTDFGLAKPVETADEPALTALGVVVGTPDYIAPEQARGDAIDERVDIYALGGTLYYLLTGVPPFRTGKPADDKYLKVVARHLKNPPPDARVRNPQADRALAKLAMRMMAKRPVDRPDYSELIEELGAIVDRLEKLEHNATEPMAALHSRAMGGQTSPTPYVGGAGPRAGDHADDAAPTQVHISRTSTADAAGGPVAKRPAVAGWLVVTTVLSALIFVVGLGLVLLGPVPPAPAPAPASIAAGGDAAVAVPDAAGAALPRAPEGMLLVVRDDGSPWFFVAARPVSHGEYTGLFPNHKVSKSASPDQPVTGVSYGYAHSYASARQKRLLTAAEWQAASQTPGFEAVDGVWEWVAADAAGDGGAGAAGKRPVRSVKGAAERDARGGKDVTFRLAADL